MICKHCGKEIDEKETCCPHCFKYTEKGELALTRLAGMKPPSKRTNEPAFGYAEDGHHTARHTCKQCGKILRDGAQVCPDCGTRSERSIQAEERAKAEANAPKCWNCKKPIASLTSTCSHCGAQPLHPTAVYTTSKAGDAPSIGYAFLGYFFPLIGFILYLVWKPDYPQRAGSVGKGALIAVIMDTIIAVFSILIVTCAVSCTLNNIAVSVPSAVGL